MIVVDANVVVYLLLGGVPLTVPAQRLLERDPSWWAPPLLQSELRQTLLGHLRHGLMTVAGAKAVVRTAELLLSGRERAVDAQRVLELASSSRCSAYDCEYVALAEQLAVPLVTADRRLAAAFPERAVPLESFG